MSGPGSVFVIAEAGVNHNGDLDQGRRLVDAAAAAGCDAVKFQTFRAEALVSRFAPKAEYQRFATRGDESQLEMIRRLELDRAAHVSLQAHCRARGIQFISTPFDPKSADLLSDLNVPLFKIPSGEITNFPLLDYIGRKGKPVILSTGMSYLAEVEAALEVLRGAGAKEITLLHCTSNYPAAPADANLLAMLTLRQAFGVPVGYSDHTLGQEVAVAAVALGATVVEKHFTLHRSLPGPDHRASLEPHELRDLVSAIRNIEQALGDGVKRPTLREEGMRAVARRSIVAASALPAGTVLAAEHLALKRPGTGLPPARLASLVGRVLRRDVAADELLTEDAVG
jgi:N-acetylneuraminate synthase/N,N'-diacetyllegionaminate synthase